MGLAGVEVSTFRVFACMVRSHALTDAGKALGLSGSSGTGIINATRTKQRHQTTPMHFLSTYQGNESALGKPETNDPVSSYHLGQFTQHAARWTSGGVGSDLGVLVDCKSGMSVSVGASQFFLLAGALSMQVPLRCFCHAYSR